MSEEARLSRKENGRRAAQRYRLGNPESWRVAARKRHRNALARKFPGSMEEMVGAAGTAEAQAKVQCLAPGVPLNWRATWMR